MLKNIIDLNIIKSDVYKMLKMRSFYWIAGVITFLNLQGILITFVLLPYIENYNPPLGFKYTSLTVIILLKDQGIINLVPVLLTCCIATIDFKTKTIRNILSRGIKRVDYYVSKVLMVFSVSFAILILRWLSVIILGSFFAEFGTIDGVFFVWLFTQIFNIFCVSCCTVAVSMLVKSNVSFLSLIWTFAYFVPIFVLSFLEPFASNDHGRMIKENVQDFFLFFLIPLSNTDDPCFFLKNIFASFVWATVSTTLGIWHFRKKEIR